MNLRHGTMSVQKCVPKFTQLSMYALHMVADPRAQMSKFLLGISDLVKTQCMNNMLLEDMNVCRRIIHAQQVKGDKLREMAKDNMKARTWNY